VSGFPPYGPDSIMWRVNRERLVLLAGPAAAILQAAHPQVAMGVAAHSRFREDAMGRLSRTLDAVYAIAFGTEEEVRHVRQAVAKAHRPVRGDGYNAFDPDAQLWVMATLIMGSVDMYERFVKPLEPGEKNRLLHENTGFGEVFGLDPAMMPECWEDFERYWHGMLDGALLGSHPFCGEVARAVIRPDKPWWMAMMSPIIGALALGIIPADLAERLGISSGVMRKGLWAGLDAMLPRVLRVLPRRIRFARQYRDAARRESKA